MIAFGIGAAAAMSIISSGQLKEARQAVADKQEEAARAYALSTQADEIVAKAEGVIRNKNLATAMLSHNGVYPDLYQNLFRYNPPYFRLTSITASPVDAETATVTMTGTISTYQQYADLMLAVMRNPRVKSVARAGYQDTKDLYVPPLLLTDQQGKPHKPGETPIPDDPLERLAYFQSQGQPAGYLSAGNFGSGTDNERLAKPGDSLITLTLNVAANLQVPNPRATLAASGGGGASVGTTPASGPLGGAGGFAPGGPPPAGAPAGGGSAPKGAGKGRGKGGADDSD
ncbi:hypothetical protein OP10G_2408 [Fimbriimonas ginsengisoli Gsoil 348]|uniref:Uncharacterized protein n=2 Tax=Fimbriimonas ginsengisoli TaxID=1005039 RepID=A0A068NQQ6_FIMGI|nr:hypothetical protein OP10G_2408 [Fimbriimonas ginsengisoli Gsoil 348]